MAEEPLRDDVKLQRSSSPETHMNGWQEMLWRPWWTPCCKCPRRVQKISFSNYFPTIEHSSCSCHSYVMLIVAICESHKRPKLSSLIPKLRPAALTGRPSISIGPIDCWIGTAAYYTRSSSSFLTCFSENSSARRNTWSSLASFLCLQLIHRQREARSGGGNHGELRDKAEDQRRGRRTSARRAADAGDGGGGRGGAEGRGGRGAGRAGQPARCRATKRGAQNDLNSHAYLSIITHSTHPFQTVNYFNFFGYNSVYRVFRCITN